MRVVTVDPDRYRVIGGVSLIGGGVVTVLGFVTAEASHPGYSTSAQAISALGAAGATPASQTAFNSTMILAGVLLLVTAYALQRAYSRRMLGGTFAVTGVGTAGSGLFPLQTGLTHLLAAVVSFGGIGIAALAVAATVRGAFRYVSVVLGLLELIAFVLFITLGGATPLGIGGLERWVAYVGTLWLTAFGGFLLGNDRRRV